MQKKISARAKELYDFYDSNQDGYISRGEFILVVDTLFGEKGLSISSRKFDESDLDSNNQISFDEFCNFGELSFTPIPTSCWPNITTLFCNCDAIKSIVINRVAENLGRAEGAKVKLSSKSFCCDV